MFMEIGTAIVGLVLIAIVVVPFLMISKGKKDKEKRMLHLLTTEANRVECTITEYESCGNIIIGIDQEAGMVFFVKTKGDASFSEAVNLAGFQSCEIVARNRSRGGASNDSVIDKLELLFRSTTSGKADLALEFYNGAENFQLNDELTVMKKWAKSINNELLTKA